MVRFLSYGYGRNVKGMVRTWTERVWEKKDIETCLLVSPYQGQINQVPTWWWVPKMHYLSGFWKWETAKCFISTPKSWTFWIKLSLKWSCLWSPLSLWIFFPCYKMWVQFTSHCSLHQWIHYFSISSNSDTSCCRHWISAPQKKQ